MNNQASQRNLISENISHTSQTLLSSTNKYMYHNEPQKYVLRNDYQTKSYTTLIQGHSIIGTSYNRYQLQCYVFDGTGIIAAFFLPHCRFCIDTEAPQIFKSMKYEGATPGQQNPSFSHRIELQIMKANPSKDMDVDISVLQAFSKCTQLQLLERVSN